jgi:hypothetical protein
LFEVWPGEGGQRAGPVLGCADSGSIGGGRGGELFLAEAGRQPGRAQDRR